MATTYTRCPQEVADLLAELINEYHPQIKDAGVTFDLLFAESDSGNPVKCRGRSAYAVVRIISPLDRAKGMADAEIKIDMEKYEAFEDDDERRALLDHELEHVVPVVDDANGGFKRDDYGRPKLRMREHDVEVGWFAKIAERWGVKSVERKQARQIFDDHGNQLFPFLAEPQPELKIMPPPGKTKAAA